MEEEEEDDDDDDDDGDEAAAEGSLVNQSEVRHQPLSSVTWHRETR